MSEIEQIVHELKCAFDGEAWHGPALMEILDGVDANNIHTNNASENSLASRRRATLTIILFRRA